MSESIERMVERQYADTHRRLRTDARYNALAMAANGEEAHNPDSWIMRNRFALYVEHHMPPVGEGKR